MKKALKSPGITSFRFSARSSNLKENPEPLALRARGVALLKIIQNIITIKCVGYKINYKKIKD